jgi:hypothetical protein
MVSATATAVAVDTGLFSAVATAAVVEVPPTVVVEGEGASTVLKDVDDVAFRLCRTDWSAAARIRCARSVVDVVVEAALLTESAALLAESAALLTKALQHCNCFA